jgi:alpha-L-fucosidase
MNFVDLYYTTVGRNASLSLGLSPGRDGLIPQSHVDAMIAQKKQLDKEFADNLVKGAAITSNNVRDAQFAPDNCLDDNTENYWATADGVNNASVVIDFGHPVSFNRLLLQEYIRLGQRIKSFEMEAFDGDWKSIAIGTTIGYKRVLRFDDVTAAKVRVSFQTDAPCLTLSSLGLYHAPKNVEFS